MTEVVFIRYVVEKVKQRESLGEQEFVFRLFVVAVSNLLTFPPGDCLLHERQLET